MDGEFVSKEHFKDVTERIEDKVDSLIERLDPKLDMIVRIDAVLGFAKWAGTILFGSGIVFSVLKVIEIIRRINGK